MNELIHRICCFCYLLLGFYLISNAQPLHPSDGELYRDDVIPRIDILIPQDSLDWILASENRESNRHFRATFIFDNGTVRDTMEEIGFRLRGNTSRASGKKSFKVSFNTFEPGRKYRGVEKVNLNGEHNDPSLSRAKISWDLAREIGVPAARTNHVALYINDAFFGVYLNVEHIDEEFVKKRFGNNGGNLYKCLWPADLNYKGRAPSLYKESRGGRRTYDLKTNTDADDYSDLARFIEILNTTPLSDLPCELEKVFNVDNYLKSIALDILIANWDGPIYNKNNFYLYRNLITGQFEYIPYDLDNTFGIDWFNIAWSTRDIYQWSPGSESRPIYERLMQVPEYKDRFSYYMNEILDSVYEINRFIPILDSLRVSLDPLVSMDTYYRRSYGFSISDFWQSFEGALSYNHTKDGLKSFIAVRSTTVLTQLTLNDIPPVISSIRHNRPGNGEDIEVSVRIEDGQAVNDVEFCYYTTDPNSLTCLSMKDDGMSQDMQAGDGIYGVVIPPLNQAGVLHYVIKATDDQNQEALYPRCESNKLFVGKSNLSVAINEFMASNSTSIADDAGEFDDWIELYNYGIAPIYLGDKYLSDKPDQPNKWQLADVWIQPGQYLLFWADEDGSQGPRHANFKLSSAGETLGLYDTDSTNFALIDEISFESQEADISYGRLPDGTGSWQAMPATPAAMNGALGIEDLQAWNLELTLAPIPFSHELQMDLKNPNQHSLSIQIVGTDGREVVRRDMSHSFSGQIDTRHLASGLYIFMLRSSGGIIYTQKIIKG